MTYMEAAHARMLHALAKNAPVSLSVYPTADELEALKAHLANVSAAVDDYVSCIAREAASNCRHENIIASEFVSVVTDAIHDSSLPGYLQNEADALRDETPSHSERRVRSTYVGAP